MLPTDLGTDDELGPAARIRSFVAPFVDGRPADALRETKARMFAA
jgi:hypothetical protein